MNLQKQVSVDCYCPAEPCAQIIDSGRCKKRCVEKLCLYVCPAGLFIEQEGEVVLGNPGICLECGACRLVCDNINFDYPEGGKGIIHQFG